MAEPMVKNKIRYSFQPQHLSLLAAIAIFIVIVFGVVIRTSQGGGCPDWPTCYGAVTPPADPAALPDYLHRVASGIAFLLLVVATWWSRREHPGVRVIYRPLQAAVGLLAVQIILGALSGLGVSSSAGSLHLALALIVQSLALAGAVTGFMHKRLPLSSSFTFWKAPFTRLSLITGAAVLLLLISGSLVASSGGVDVCQGWPLCNGRFVPASLEELLHLGHRFLTGLTGILMIGLLLRAWRTQRTQIAVLTTATATVTLFFAQSLMGAVNAAEDYPAYLIGLHTATAVAIWAGIVVLITLAGFSGRSNVDEAADVAAFPERRLKQLLVDFFMLTKPIVVALLLVTTFAGMVIGAQDWPSPHIVFWTLLGGFLAAGGSGAINQYIDREDDARMQRTARRPIPSGRLTAGEGLAFGVAISLASFFLMTAFVNFLAALLTLAGIIYYVVLYSLLLKKLTVQNIVIGGGAGAIPPLVGWAAATGSLTIPSLLLFAVVFMWTPPHFWALAIVRRADYARAGVPMLPVVRGQAEARWQVFLYTVELVALTLLLPLLGLGGSIYFVSAVVLGGLLLMSAYRVWRQEGNKIAWKMYRHSSMYLAFLFLALMIDRLI
jgi:heme o synthase